MNERIFQLAKQAQIKFEAHLQHLGIDTAVITPADLEKFAELIVQDCVAEVALVGVTNFENEAISWACRVIIDGIKSKFGV